MFSDEKAALKRCLPEKAQGKVTKIVTHSYCTLDRNSDEALVIFNEFPGPTFAHSKGKA